MEPSSRLVPHEFLREITGRIFLAHGLPRPAAGTVADALVDADMRGIASHGLMLVPMYSERLRAGSVTTATEASVQADLGAVATLDAGNALGILTGDQAMALAISKARAFGVGVVAVRHAFHFGAAFRYARAATREQMIGIAAANTRPLMPAPGGAQPVVGNNPIAIGVPAPDQPVILDMAMSEVALGRIRLAEQEGLTIPDTWATDRMGVPTTDPTAAIAGMLLPMAGPKGYGLALMVDVLTGVLSGGVFGAAVKGLYSDPSQPNDCSHLFVALAPGAFGDPAAFAAGIRGLTAEVGACALAPGVDRVLLPGQLEAERSATALERGVPMRAVTLRALADLALQAGVGRDELSWAHA